MPFYFRTLDQHGGMEKKVYELRILLMAYAQFESYLLNTNSCETCRFKNIFITLFFVIEPSARSFLFSFAASFFVFDFLGIL